MLRNVYVQKCSFLLYLSMGSSINDVMAIGGLGIL